MADPQLKTLHDEIDLLRKQLKNLQAVSVRSEYTGGFQNYEYANLPPANKSGKVAYCTDCRKSGEGAGAGTGVLVVVTLLAAVLTWSRVDDPTQAAAT